LCFGALGVFLHLFDLVGLLLDGGHKSGKHLVYMTSIESMLEFIVDLILYPVKICHGVCVCVCVSDRVEEG
jgi:hypothetical protein